MRKLRLGIFPSSQKAFTLNEALIAISLVGLLSFVMIQILKAQANEKRAAEIKSTLNILHTQAQQAVMKYEISDDFDKRLKTDSQFTGVNLCFHGNGSGCDTVAKPAFTGFTVATAGDRWDQLNRTMNGAFTLEGSKTLASGIVCSSAICPVSVQTTWTFECAAESCKGINFSSSVSINPALVSNTESKVLIASIPTLTWESEYSRTKQVGLLRNIASTCAQEVVPTGTNFDTGTTECAQEEAASTNKLFDSNMGFDFENADLRLIAGSTTGGTTTSGTTGSTDNCPPGTVAKMTDAGVVCTEPPLLCTNAGWVVSGGRCCNPTIPNGGDGWDQFGSCSAQCSPSVGKHTRSCLYPKEDYCSSVCSRGATDTEDCSGKPTAPDLTGLGKGWSNWGACSTVCGGGTQVSSCTEGTDKGYCADCSASDPAKTQNCNTQLCCKSSGTRLAGTWDPDGGPGDQGKNGGDCSSAQQVLYGAGTGWGCCSANVVIKNPHSYQRTSRCSGGKDWDAWEGYCQ